MKKNITTLIMLMVIIFSFTSCYYQENYKEDYYDIYNNGYNEGYDDGYDIGREDGYYDGVEDGWQDNIDEIGWWFEGNAIRYARERSSGGWVPEEAWGIIEAYQNNEPLYDNEIPSEQEYHEAVDSLICFYEYFYGKHYQ